MEFILQQQAKAEGQMAALRTIVRTGMKMIVKQGEQIRQLAEGQKQVREEMAELRREVAAELKELTRAQKVTEAKLQGLIDITRRGGNGRHFKN